MVPCTTCPLPSSFAGEGEGWLVAGLWELSTASIVVRQVEFLGPATEKSSDHYYSSLKSEWPKREYRNIEIVILYFNGLY